MGAAISVFVLLSLSVFVIRIASVALRLTGLAQASARFQALSAFTGTGFTTSEAEAIVNYPVRRRIVSMLMTIGNLGLVTVLATLVVSFVNTQGEFTAIAKQLVWLLGCLALLWFLMLNKTADRIMCSLIGKLLESTTVLGTRGFHRLLQIGDGYSVCEHPVDAHMVREQGRHLDSLLTALQLELLAIQSSTGKLIVDGATSDAAHLGDRLVLFGRDDRHEAFVKQAHD